MNDPQQPAGGLFGSLRTFFETGLGVLQNRIELFSVELREEKFRISELILWLAATIALAILTLAILTLTVIFLFWEQRLAVAAGLAAFYALGTVGLLVGLNARLKREPAPFSATLEELRKDRACWGDKN